MACFKPGRYTMDFLQVVISFFLALGAPIAIYFLLDQVGVDITGAVYMITQVLLLVSATLIITECMIASYHKGAPKKSQSPNPPASAIICAYMPNEQHTIKETIEHFLQIKYEPGLQVILSYNSPFYCPVESELRDLADKFPNFELLKVENSKSKAENLNTALEYVTGDFVGCFDADHMPDEGSYERAWRWLSNGYKVVQGHCLVRNPCETFWSKMVAIEFETIYALAHPGRTVRDNFGIFGGSNGYWMTDTLKRIGMVGAMLTEDIDSSMRVLEEGGKIGTDPELISRELATTTFLQLWNQRLRWSQGWFQVSMKHCWPMMKNPHFGVRERFGAFTLLFVREIYPWFSIQILPLLLFWTLKGEHIQWGIRIFIATSVYTACVGPVNVIFAYYVSHKSLRKPMWFFIYMCFATVFYTEMKNTMCRVGHIKQFFGETGWRVTPRSANAPIKELDGDDTGYTSRTAISDEEGQLDMSQSPVDRETDGEQNNDGSQPIRIPEMRNHVYGNLHIRKVKEIWV